MGSTLLITHVDRLQSEAVAALKASRNAYCVYASLNKPQAGLAPTLKKAGVDLSKVFFIDCVASEQTSSDVVHVQPTRLDELAFAVNSFVSEIPGKKLVLVDGLSTLLIYNDENKVAAFVKAVAEHAAGRDAEVIALSPETKGEELLNKIFNFFDSVKRKK